MTPKLVNAWMRDNAVDDTIPVQTDTQTDTVPICLKQTVSVVISFNFSADRVSARGKLNHPTELERNLGDREDLNMLRIQSCAGFSNH